MPYHADYERRIAQLEQDMANLRLLIADLKPRVESIESDLAAIMQEEPEAYDEHGFVPGHDPSEAQQKLMRENMAAGLPYDAGLAELRKAEGYPSC